MTIHFGLKLISGPDNIHPFPKDNDASWLAGDILMLSSGITKPMSGTPGTSESDLDSDLFGVAVTTEAASAAAETAGNHAPVHVFTPEQVWSIKVEDATRAYDYSLGTSYEIGYYGTSSASAYDVGYVSGATAKTAAGSEEFYYLVSSSLGAGKGAVVVAKPSRGLGDDLKYGGRVHVRFTPAACKGISG